METPVTGESEKRTALSPASVEPGRSGEGQGTPPVSVAVGGAQTRAIYVPGSMQVLGRVGDFVVESGLIAGVVAAIALLVFVFVWQIFLPISLALAVGVHFGVAMLLPAPNPDKLVIDGLTASELQRVLAAGRASLARIERDVQLILTPGARLFVLGIARTANRILADFEERPRHVAEARFAFDALLDAMVMAMDRYRKFWRASGAVAQRGREVLEERVFPTIDRGFQQLLDNLLKDDLRALNVDVAVLEQMLDLEGLAVEGAANQAESAGVAEVGSGNRAQIASADVVGTQKKEQAK